MRSQALLISNITKSDSTQRIFPDMYFSCTGLITKWIIGGEPHIPRNPAPELQLWRRTKGTKYVKTSVTCITSLPNRTPHNNVYEYVLDSPLEFQNGDVFGLYKPRENESVLNIFLQENSGPFAYGPEDGTDLALKKLTVDLAKPLDLNDYPMVSVEISIKSK